MPGKAPGTSSEPLSPILATAPSNAIDRSLLMKEDRLLCLSTSGLAAATAASRVMKATTIFLWRKYLRLPLKRSSSHLLQVPPLELYTDVWRHDVVLAVSSCNVCRGKANRNQVRHKFRNLHRAHPPLGQG